MTNLELLSELIERIKYNENNLEYFKYAIERLIYLLTLNYGELTEEDILYLNYLIVKYNKLKNKSKERTR